MARLNYDTFLSGNNATFIAELYSQYLENPSSVDPTWKSFFADLGDSETDILQDLMGASWGKKSNQIIGVFEPQPASAKGKAAPAPSSATAPISKQEIINSLRALMLIRVYRVRGHLYAKLDPLQLSKTAYHPELDPKNYGFTDENMDQPIYIDGVLGLEQASMREILARLHEIYCSNVGVEYMHIQDPDQKAWIQEKIESSRNRPNYSVDEKKEILSHLTKAESFEKFLQVKYVGTKRFGLEGGESAIPSIELVLKRSVELGLEEAVFGMAHRGRLNVLTNIMQKPFSAIFSEFQGTPANPEDVQGSGDVKYHLGTSSDRMIAGKQIHLSLTANPSHLEAVNPVSTGKARAKQDQRKDHDRSRVLCILLHGDAAFAGQGIVAETLMMSNLDGYRIGGTIHIITNNQIGFTTMPLFSRSGQYATEVAKMIQAPILHVNGDNPEAVAHVSQIAAEFRHKFGQDIVIDIVCYRRHGHNEGDEPGFTQPLMYDAIKNHTTTRTLYANALIQEKAITPAESEQMQQDFLNHLETEFKKAATYKPQKADWLEGKWTGFTNGSATGNGSNKKEIAAKNETTGIADKTLKEVGAVLSAVPTDVNLHSKIVRQLQAKADMFKSGEEFDWATAEALAFGTLVNEGHHVRLSGQDCGRGTFSQRHAIMYDQTTEARYIPLSHISKNQAVFEVHDSPLSEYGVLGFEHGYSLAEPNSLVLWEAQFGDFVNGAQIMIDQFISSSESKWLRLSGLTMLLPHGYEGNGPEHSSARPERFLQLCAEENMQVANITTPANYFHALRRQVKRNYRKPLIIMTPKSLLRHKLCVSSLKDMAQGTNFMPMIPEIDSLASNDKIKRVVITSGKVYYDLLAARREEIINNVAILRIEEYYPFPTDLLKAELKKYPNAEIIWCQEEPKNMGAWFFVRDYIEEIFSSLSLKQNRLIYVGRAAAASPATGSQKKHIVEQAQLVKDALHQK